MYIKLDGGRRIHYELIGRPDAPVVLFTHSLSADMGMWVEQIPDLLGAGYRVLRVDARGHGGSDAVAGDYTMEQLADDVADVLQHLSLGPVDYVGLSIGGVYGQALALKHPDLIRSLTLCDTLPAALPGSSASWQERMATARQAGSLAPLVEATLGRWFTPDFLEREPLRSQQIRESILATSVDGFVGSCAAMQAFDFTKQLPNLHVPALVICGAEDPGTPPAENRRLAGLMPAARYEEIPGCRHLPNVQKPGEFNGILLRWLRSRR